MGVTKAKKSVEFDLTPHYNYKSWENMSDEFLVTRTMALLLEITTLNCVDEIAPQRSRFRRRIERAALEAIADYGKIPFVLEEYEELPPGELNSSDISAIYSWLHARIDEGFTILVRGYEDRITISTSRRLFNAVLDKIEAVKESAEQIADTVMESASSGSGSGGEGSEAEFSENT